MSSRPQNARPPLGDGLHQAVEAKEGAIDRERDVGEITIQNYFRLYPNDAGMTGHGGNGSSRVSRYLQARREHDSDDRPVRAHRYNDRIYKTRREKYNAVIKEIKKLMQRSARLGWHCESEPPMYSVDVEA